MMENKDERLNRVKRFRRRMKESGHRSAAPVVLGVFLAMIVAVAGISASYGSSQAKEETAVTAPSSDHYFTSHYASFTSVIAYNAE